MAKKTLVTAALPYINNVPHFGHIAGSHLPADIYARFCRSRGDEVKFIGGSDEHGTPSVVAAREIGVEPKKLVDALHGIHRRIYDAFNIDYTIYSRTSKPEHHEMTQSMFEKIRENGYLHDGFEDRFYCPNDQRFLPDRFVEGTCVHCGFESANADQCEQCTTVLQTSDLSNPSCKICGMEPELRETRNLYFELDQLSDELEEWIEGHQEDWKSHVYGEAMKWIDEGLERRSISREMSWGVNIPMDDFEDNVFYVWFDAPIGYMSFTKELGAEVFEEYWEDPEAEVVHFLGKDNIPFHSIFWPAMLMADGRYNLPENVVGYHYLNFEGKVFSKSRDVGVFCYNILDSDNELEVDAIRSYLTSVLPETRDSNFRWEDFRTHKNSELIAKLGNLLNRTLNMIGSYFDGTIDCSEPDSLRETDEEFIETIRERPNEIRTAYENMEFRKALRSVLQYARDGNLYLEQTAPWEAMSNDETEKARVSLALVLNLCRSLCITAAPILPEGMQRAWSNQLNLEGSVHDQGRWEETGNLELNEEHTIGTPEPLYDKLDEEDLERMKKQFATSPSLEDLVKNN